MIKGHPHIIIKPPLNLIFKTNLYLNERVLQKSIH